MKIAVFASGNGSNFQALVDYFRENKLPDTFEWLFCDQPNAFVLERAEKLHVPFNFFSVFFFIFINYLFTFYS